MKLLCLSAAFVLFVPAFGAQAVPTVTEPSPSFRFETKGGSAPKECHGTMVAQRKGTQCYAVTAKECLAEAKQSAGKTRLVSKQFGEHDAEFFVAPGNAALLVWACGEDAKRQIPHFELATAFSTKPIRKGMKVKYGKAFSPTEPTPPQLYPGAVVASDGTQTTVKPAGPKSDAGDLGQPLLCRGDMGMGTVDEPDAGVDGQAALCGVLVDPKHLGFATDKAMTFVREKLKALGVADPKLVVVDGKRFVREAN